MYPPEKSNKGNEKNGKGLLVILCISVNYFMRIDLNESIISKNDNDISKKLKVHRYKNPLRVTVIPIFNWESDSKDEVM